ncbi:methylglyoxal synthase [Rhodospirillum sp. A1_3_36]|uniref:methylglyoxal synthase n=1 Tax=Rhodospirillum sp. A1_3_36 TaxID=3391666 RepID=UPI0039A57420
MSSPKIGLVATANQWGEGALRDLLAAFRKARALGWQGTLHPVGETADFLAKLGDPLPSTLLHPFPAARDGGLVRMVAGLVTEDPDRRIDQVVSLLEPDDPLGVFPEVEALKRQCVVQRRPYLPNVETAAHWWRLESGAGEPAGWAGARTIALVAHDSFKGAMLDFAARHMDLLARFKGRVATGTTGTLLNGQVPDRLSSAEMAVLGPLSAPFRDRAGWVSPLLSGPKGGDVEIADRILDGACDVVVFFEDPFISREHEADIQLLERVVRLPGVQCLCFHDPSTSDLWAGWMGAVTT